MSAAGAGLERCLIVRHATAVTSGTLLLSAFGRDQSSASLVPERLGFPWKQCFFLSVWSRLQHEARQLHPGGCQLRRGKALALKAGPSLLPLGPDCSGSGCGVVWGALGLPAFPCPAAVGRQLLLDYLLL